MQQKFNLKSFGKFAETPLSGLASLSQNVEWFRRAFHSMQIDPEELVMDKLNF